MHTVYSLKLLLVSSIKVMRNVLKKNSIFIFEFNYQQLQFDMTFTKKVSSIFIRAWLFYN